MTDAAVSFEKFRLPHVYVSYLKSLIQEGKGVGRLDMTGRVEAGPTKTLLPGSPVDWLQLFVWGCVMAAEDRWGYFEVSPLGHDFVQQHEMRLKGGRS